MKWFVGPRRAGKSTQQLKRLYQNPKIRYFVAHNHVSAEQHLRAFIGILGNERFSLAGKSAIMWFHPGVGPRTVVFQGWDEFVQGNHIRKDKSAMITELDLILQRYVKLEIDSVSGTGPVFEFPLTTIEQLRPEGAPEDDFMFTFKGEPNAK